MNTIEQAREVSLRLKRAPLQNGSNFHSDVADTIDALLAELEAAHAVGVRQEALIMEREAELAALKSQQPVATLHDDGYWTWIGTPPYESSFVGWRQQVFLAAGAQGGAA